MLLQIRDYLSQEKVASNQQIAREFGLELDALQPMLDIWQSKGLIMPCQEKSNCKSPCQNCRTPPVYYRMVLG